MNLRAPWPLVEALELQLLRKPHSLPVFPLRSRRQLWLQPRISGFNQEYLALFVGEITDGFSFGFHLLFIEQARILQLSFHCVIVRKWSGLVAVGPTGTIFSCFFAFSARLRAHGRGYDCTGNRSRLGRRSFPEEDRLLSEDVTAPGTVAGFQVRFFSVRFRALPSDLEEELPLLRLLDLQVDLDVPEDFFDLGVFSVEANAPGAAGSLLSRPLRARSSPSIAGLLASARRRTAVLASCFTSFALGISAFFLF